MKNIKAKDLLSARPKSKLEVWAMRVFAERKRKKWERSSKYAEAVKVTREIIEKAPVLMSEIKDEQQTNRR